MTTIKQLRSEAKLTQKGFGKFLNIPHRTIQNWEGGQSQCPPYVIELIEYKLTNEKMINKKSGLE